MWYLISTNLFWSIFVTKSSSRFLLVLITLCLPAYVLVILDELALSLTFWQINHSPSFKGYGLGTSCTALDGPDVLFDIGPMITVISLRLWEVSKKKQCGNQLLQVLLLQLQLRVLLISTKIPTTKYNKTVLTYGL